jgi:hypothetical protein
MGSSNVPTLVSTQGENKKKQNSSWFSDEKIKDQMA